MSSIAMVGQRRESEEMKCQVLISVFVLFSSHKWYDICVKRLCRAISLDNVEELIEFDKSLSRRYVAKSIIIYLANLTKCQYEKQ